MNPKEWRDKLFKDSRPLVRKHAETDNGFLWAAYQRGSFNLPEGLGQPEFLIAMSEAFGSYDDRWMIEDDSKGFRSGRGPVAIVGIQTDGWAVVPQAFFFQWATKENVLRAMVGFFQMIRYQKDIGVCRVEVLADRAKQLNRMKKYGVLYFRGRIPNGSVNGDVCTFSIAGKRSG